MKVRRRHRMAQIIYRAPLSNGITGFAAAAHHQNWSNHGGLQNNLTALGLSLRHWSEKTSMLQGWIAAMVRLRNDAPQPKATGSPPHAYERCFPVRRHRS